MAYKLAGKWGPEPFVSSTTGRPLISTAFSVYKRDGVTLATLYTSRAKAASPANPTATDAYGNGAFWADPGDYVISCNGVTQAVTIGLDSSEDYGGARRQHDLGVATPIIAETVKRNECSADLAALTTQIVQLQAIELPPRTLCTSLSYISGATAASVPTNWWFVLVSKALAVLAVSADQTSTAWAANTLKTLAFGAAYTTPDLPDLYYVGIMMKATTPVSLRGPAAMGNAIMATAFTPTLCGASSVGQTTPPALAAVLTAITGGVNIPYAAVS